MVDTEIKNEACVNDTIHQLKKDIEQSGGYIRVVKHFTYAFNHAITHLGDKIDCPFPHRHREGGGTGDFRMFSDFDTRGKAICTCADPCFDIFDLLVASGSVADLHEALTLVNEFVNGENSATHCITHLDVDKKDRHASKNRPDLIRWRRNLMKTVESESRSFDYACAEPARLYFRNRGVHLDNHPQVLFHPHLELRLNGSCCGFYPTILWYVRDRLGKAVTFHRTLITQDGFKADIDSPKLPFPEIVAGTLMGSSVAMKDCKESRLLHVGEGTELMYAISECVEGSVKSGLSRDGMAAMDISREDYDKVLIWSDKDPLDERTQKGGGGQRCAKKLAQRLMSEGFEVAILEPDFPVAPTAKKGVDWENVIVCKNVLQLPFEQRWTTLLGMANIDTLLPESINAVDTAA